MGIIKRVGENDFRFVRLGSNDFRLAACLDMSPCGCTGTMPAAYLVTFSGVGYCNCGDHYTTVEPIGLGMNRVWRVTRPDPTNVPCYYESAEEVVILRKNWSGYGCVGDVTTTEMTFILELVIGPLETSIYGSGSTVARVFSGRASSASQCGDLVIIGNDLYGPGACAAYNYCYGGQALVVAE